MNPLQSVTICLCTLTFEQSKPHAAVDRGIQGGVFTFMHLFFGWCVEGAVWFPPKGSSVALPPWGGVSRWVFVFRSWGSHPRPQVLTYSLHLSGTCADSIEADGRSRSRGRRGDALVRVLRGRFGLNRKSGLAID